MKLAEIADRGDDLATLKLLRHKLAAAIDESKSGRDISSLSRQLQMVMTRIAEIENEQGITDDIDEIIRQHRDQRVRSGGRPMYGSGFDEDDEEEDE